VFPLVEMYSEKSAFLKPVIRRLKKEGFSTKVVKVPYEFLRGGDKMLVISRSSRPKSRIRRLLGF
jgi:ribosomal protein S28E/S33